MNGKMKIKLNVSLLYLIVSLLFVKSIIAQNVTGHLENAKIKLSFGNTNPTRSLKNVQLIEGSPGLKVSNLAGKGIEKSDKVGNISVLDCGGGDAKAFTRGGQTAMVKAQGCFIMPSRLFLNGRRNMKTISFIQRMY